MPTHKETTLGYNIDAIDAIDAIGWNHLKSLVTGWIRQLNASDICWILLMLGLGGCSPVFARTIFYRIFLAMVVKPRWGRHFLWHTQSFWAAICDVTILRFWRLQGNRRLCCALRQAVSIFGNLGQWGPREEFGPLMVWWIDLARRLKKNKMRELS